MIAAVLLLEVLLHLAAPRIRIAVNMQYDPELGHRGVGVLEGHRPQGQEATPRPGRHLGQSVVLGPQEAGRLGRKVGKGFYLYHEGHKSDPDPEAYKLVGVTPLASVDAARLEQRLVYIMLNEAAMAALEGVVRSPRDGDVGAIFGIGYPPFRGGPLRYIDMLGATRVVQTLESLAAAYGPRFTPAPALVAMAREGRRFHRD